MQTFQEFLDNNHDYKVEIKTRDEELIVRNKKFLSDKDIIRKGQYRPEPKAFGKAPIQNTTKEIEKLREQYDKDVEDIKLNSRYRVYAIAEKHGKDHPDYPRWLKKEKRKDILREQHENDKSMGLSKKHERHMGRDR